MKLALACMLLALSGRSLASAQSPFQSASPEIARYSHLPDTVSIEGVVITHDGAPVNGADIYVFGRQTQVCPFPRLPTLELGRGKTEQSGQFVLTCGTMSDTSFEICVIAPGHAAKFVSFAGNVGPVNIGNIMLAEDRPIMGKILGPNGNPAQNVLVEVRCMIRSDASSKFEMSWLGSPKPGMLPAPITAQSDSDGSFILPNLPADITEIWIRIDDERFAPFERVGNFESGRTRDGVISLNRSSDSPIEIKLDEPLYVSGTVKRRDTEEILPNAWVGVTVSDMPLAADSAQVSIWGKTDNHGRYQIRCGRWASLVHAYVFAPPGVPCYDWSVGPIKVPSVGSDLELPIVMPVGKLVKGKVVSKPDGQPIAGASLVYIIRRDRPQKLSRDDAHRVYWSNEYHYRYTSADGSFEQPIPPGEIGTILAKCPDGSFVQHVTSYGEIQSGEHLPWWSVLHGSVVVDETIAAIDQPLEVSVHRGYSVRGEVVDENGQPVNGGVIIRSTPRHDFSFQMYPEKRWTQPFTGGKFAVDGCALNSKTEMYFLDHEKKNGGVLTIQPGATPDASLRVVLRPCGNARVRFVNKNGVPLSTKSVEALLSTSALSLSLAFAESAKKLRHQIYMPEDALFGCPYRYSHPILAKNLQPQNDGSIIYQSLIPNAPYKLAVIDEDGWQSGSTRVLPIRVSAGEMTDLGVLMASQEK